MSSPPMLFLQLAHKHEGACVMSCEHQKLSTHIDPTPFQVICVTGCESPCQSLYLCAMFFQKHPAKYPPRR